MTFNLTTLMVILVVAFAAIPAFRTQAIELVHVLRASWLVKADTEPTPWAEIAAQLLPLIYVDGDGLRHTPRRVSVTVPRPAFDLTLSSVRPDVVTSILGHLNKLATAYSREHGLSSWKAIRPSDITFEFTAGQVIEVRSVPDADDLSNAPAPTATAAATAAATAPPATATPTIPPTSYRPPVAGSSSSPVIPPTAGVDFVFLDLVVAGSYTSTVPLTRAAGRVAVGRGPDNGLVVPAEVTMVSSVHVVISMRDLDHVVARDISRFGTFVLSTDGSFTPLVGEQVLPRGARLALGAPSADAPVLEIR